jgi:hypothetical protein
MVGGGFVALNAAKGMAHARFENTIERRSIQQSS